jgi:hypothetical protein
MRLLVITILLSFGSAVAPLLSLAGEVHRVYEGMVVRAKVSRFREGDTVIYHTLRGDTIAFILGSFLGEGEHGRVFVLSGSNPPHTVKFLTENDRHITQNEIDSFQLLDKQGLPHARIEDHNADFYIIKNLVQGQSIASLEEELPRLSRPKRTRLILDLSHAIEPFLQALRNGPYGFEDLHAGNVIFDGKALHIIDVGSKNTNPESTATAFRNDLKRWHYLDSALRLTHEDPKWLELFYDLQESSGKPYLDTEAPGARALREAFRSGHSVPVVIQEKVVMMAMRETSSPHFQEKVEPMLKSILGRGQIDGPYVKTLNHLFSNKEKLAPQMKNSSCLLQALPDAIKRHGGT